MNIHEYQAKEILNRYGVPVPQGRCCSSVEDAVNAAKAIASDRWVVKAQIHAGGRGEGGGVRIAHSLDEVRQYSSEILGMTLVTHQTGPSGKVVRILLVEEGVSICEERYLGLVVDRDSQRIVLVTSSEGGTAIESVARDTPEKIYRVPIDPTAGLSHASALEAARGTGAKGPVLAQIANVSERLYKLFWEQDASLAEINPLVTTQSDDVIALDAKINFDDNALFRNPTISSLRDLDEEDPSEIEASKHGLNYIALDGNIGCLVNGAGLAMATMDIIKFYGAEPANFLDVGGGASDEQVTHAFRVLLENNQLRAILVNIFGGIMRCDVVAQGLVNAARTVDLHVPLVVRLEGTNVEQGRQILANSGLNMIVANTMDEAAKKVVQAAA